MTPSNILPRQTHLTAAVLFSEHPRITLCSTVQMGNIPVWRMSP
jgi:hypothetical protein